MTSQRSFRDPDGVTLDDGRSFYRLLRPSGRAKIDALGQSDAVRTLSASGNFIAIEEIDTAEKAAVLGAATTPWTDAVKHPRLPFITYPHEWPAPMLFDAAMLTLDIAEALLDEGRGLKDATPYNIGFRHAKPVFLDVLSIEERRASDPLWRAEAQFVRQFLLPLMCAKYFNLPPHAMLSLGPDWMTPAQVYGMCGPLRRLLPPFLWWVSLPVWLSRADSAEAATRQHVEKKPEMAAFVLSRTYKRLRRALLRVRPDAGRQSAWTDYETTRLYRPQELDTKNKFVDGALGLCPNGRVLDIGCNAGEFSLRAAAAGNHVVAMDADPLATGMAWTRTAQSAANIDVICADIARPTPAMGFGNSEWTSLLDRLSNSFDLVVAVGVLHHLLVTAGVPLDQVLRTLSDISTRFVAIEFISPQDPNFQRIARGRETLHAGLDTDAFETAAAQFFHVREKTTIVVGCRTGYILEKTAP
jgi:SAM-dependent methyltransferase